MTPSGLPGDAPGYFVIERCILDEKITVGAPEFRRPVISEPEIFLAKTYNEIVTRTDTENRTPYDLIRVAALLRQVFLDDHPLISLVNRKYKIKLLVAVPNLPAIPVRSEGLTLRGFRLVSGEQTLLSPQKFLKLECVMLNGYSYTVADVIKICANKRGGVHFDPTLNAKENALISYHLPENGLIFGRGGLDNPALFSIMQIVPPALQFIRPLVFGIQTDVKSKTRRSWLRRLSDGITDRLIYGSSSPRH